MPIHSEYRDVLEVTRTENVRLRLREDGEAWTVAGYRTAWQREMTFGAVKGEDGTWYVAPELGGPARDKAAAIKRLRDEGLVFHGLRKNAVNLLLEVGCSEAEVAAIVEMSEAMVRHYSRDVNKRRLATAAMKRLESRWKEARQNLFGGARSPLLRNERGT